MKKQAGINVCIKPHSTRAASVSSTLYIGGVPLTHIIKTASWNNSKTCAKFYNKQANEKVNK